MKTFKLLVLSVLWLFGLNASAADLIERTAPEEPSWTVDVTAIDKTPCEFKVGNVYVLYNVGTQKFYYRGNAWTTQASGSDENAIPVRFVLPGGKTLADKQLYLRDFDDRSGQNKWRTAFIAIDGHVGGVYGEGTPAIFIDNNDGTAALMWVEASETAKTYRLSISESNTNAKPEGKFFGIDPEGPAVDDGGGFCIMPKMDINTEWQFFTTPEWSSYSDALNVYDAAKDLKSVIAAAEAAGFDVSAAAAVYNNLEATVDQINAAADALNNTMSSAVSGGTAENPSVATSLITNPNFDNASNAGWKGTGPNMTGSGSHGPANVAEHYNKTFNTYQDLTDLPNGVYLLSLNSFFRGSWDDYKNGTNLEAYPALYAKAGGDTDSTTVLFNNAWSAMNLTPMAGKTEFGTTAGETSTTYKDATYFIPNDPSAFRLYEEEDFYKTAVITNVTDGKLRIGIAKNAKAKNADGTESSTDWAVFDTFGLKFYGNSAASFNAAFKDFMAAKYGIVANDCSITESYAEAYEAAVLAAVNAENITSQAEAIAAMAKPQEAIAAAAENVYENMRLWKKWESLVNDALTFKGEGFDELDEYVEYDVPEIKEAMALTNEELTAAIAQLETWIEQANMKVEPGTDVTKMYLKNADCENTDGWQGGPVKGTGGGNSCFEKYGQPSFDVYQIVKKAPKGVYSIEVQGFYRRIRPTDSYTLFQNGEQTPCGYVYMNNNATPLKCVYEEVFETNFENSGDVDSETDAEGNTVYFPNTMAQAAEAFAAGKYKSKAFGLVLNAGDELRIGVKGQEGGSDWAIWDNFKLVYEGYTADVVSPVLAEQVATAKEKLTKKMGKDVKEALAAAIAEAETALAGTDGEAMFNALVKISDINPDGSITKFENLNKRNEEFAAAIAEATVCAISTINEATALNVQITEGMENGIYTDADVDDLLAQIAAMTKKLGIPDGMDQATDANPMDVTTIIQNNDYELATNNGWTITDGVSPGFGNGLIEVFNKNFDEYQDLEGLPEGTYEVSVQGFYRFGNGVRDDSTYVQAPTENNNLKLYVTVGENTINVPMPRLAKDGKEEHTSFTKTDDGKAFIAYDDFEKVNAEPWIWLDTPVADADSLSATGMRLANDMQTVAYLFENGKFLGTSIIFKVGADGKARIGLKKEVQEDNNWCIWDNWKLTYYGANSAKEPTVDGIVSAVAATAKVEFFGLNGARISKPTKGVAIMKQTLSDGTVKTTKVIIK